MAGLRGRRCLRDDREAVHETVRIVCGAARRLQQPTLSERVAIPYEGKFLYGNLRRPANTAKGSNTAKAPVVVMCMGLDSAKEEMDDYENRFLARGVATLAFDGPGQGEGEYDFGLCPEYERPVKAVIDHIETRSDLDASRIGIWGVSLGGYFAPRAEAQKLAAEVSGPCVLSVIEGGNHVVNNLWYRYRDQTADWMARQLLSQQPGAA